MALLRFQASKFQHKLKLKGALNIELLRAPLSLSFRILLTVHSWGSSEQLKYQGSKNVDLPLRKSS